MLAVALLIFGVKEPDGLKAPAQVNPLAPRSLQALPGGYWWVVAIGAILTLARFSEAFLILRAQQGGLPVALAPLVLVVMNAVYAVAAYPFGKLADSMTHSTLLKCGIGVLIAADFALAYSSRSAWVWGGIALWGLHMGMTQGLLATMVAQAAPAELRGTAFGFFNLVSGIAMLIASALAGLLWTLLGARTTFIAGAIFSGVALLALFRRMPRST